MGNNNIKETNDILIKVDQNNLIYIDPNSVLVDGAAQSRGVEPENLVMYVNLEADLIPRTTLIDAGNQSSLRSIAGGTLNFLKNHKLIVTFLRTIASRMVLGPVNGCDDFA